MTLTMKTNKLPQTNITCFLIECKHNSGYRTEQKRGYCLTHAVAINRHGCLDKFTDEDQNIED